MAAWDSCNLFSLGKQRNQIARLSAVGDCPAADGRVFELGVGGTDERQRASASSDKRQGLR
jgi:hypothetical protein